MTHDRVGDRAADVVEVDVDAVGRGRRELAREVAGLVVEGRVEAELAGALFILGQNSQGGRFLQTFSPGYGFIALTVALLARLNPWAAIGAAFFYANMMAGANQMQINAGVPYQVQQILQSLIILTVTATVVGFTWRRRRPGRKLESN